MLEKLQGNEKIPEQLYKKAQSITQKNFSVVMKYQVLMLMSMIII